MAIEPRSPWKYLKRRGFCPSCERVTDQSSASRLDLDAEFDLDRDEIRWSVAFFTECSDCRTQFLALFSGFGADGWEHAFERADRVIWPTTEDFQARKAVDAVLELLVEKAQTDRWANTLEDAFWEHVHPGLLGIRRSVVTTVDGIPFYSDAEVLVYRALKAAVVRGWAIGIVPNSPVALVADGGFKVLYPDFQVVLGRKAGIIHVDGPHHRGRAAADHSQDRLFRRAGFAHIERLLVEDTDGGSLNDLIEEFLETLKNA
jgi:hypothetical protein